MAWQLLVARRARRGLRHRPPGPALAGAVPDNHRIELLVVAGENGPRAPRPHTCGLAAES